MTIKRSDVEKIYEDKEWVIHKVGNDMLRITLFKDCHFVDEMFITKKMFEDDDEG